MSQEKLSKDYLEIVNKHLQDVNKRNVEIPELPITAIAGGKARVLVYPIFEEVVTSSGLVIVQDQDTAAEDLDKRPTIGIVLQVSNDVEPASVKKGDKIFFNKYAGIPYIYKNVEFLVMRENDVIGLVND